jgi:hypothetical protein
MAQAVHGPLSFLNTDGKAHPKENGLVLVTTVLGLLALATAFSPGLHLIASWAGLAGLATGAWGQLVSATTGERFLAITGMGAAGLGFYLGMANGGLFGGVLG